MAIQEDQNEILDKAQYVGMKLSEKDMDRLMALMGEHGKEAVLYALDEASDHKALTLAYISKIVENYGRSRAAPEEGESFNWL